MKVSGNITFPNIYLDLFGNIMIRFPLKFISNFSLSFGDTVKNSFFFPYIITDDFRRYIRTFIYF